MQTATRAGRRIAWSAEGDGAPLLLVPGLGSGAKLFGTLPRRFARLPRRCLTFDPVGVPPSDPHTGDYDFDAAAQDLLAVLDAAGAQSCDLVGTSLGGKVALLAAARAPERIRSLTLLASSAVPSARGRRIHAWFALLAEHLPPAQFGAAVVPFLFGRTFHEQRPAVVDDIERAIRPDATNRALMVAQARALLSFDGTRAAARVRCPALALAGAEDTLTLTPDVAATARAIAGCEFAEIAEAGHSLLLESPAAFERVAAFLTSVDARTG